MQMVLFHSLRIRLASLVLLTMIVVSALVLSTYLYERSLILDHVGEDFTQVATLIANDQEQIITRTRQFLLALVRSREVQDHETATCSEFLGKLIEEYPRYSNLGVADLNGNLVCSGHPIASPLSLVDEPWFKHTVRSRDFAMAALHEQGETNSAFAISCPLRKDTGDLSGVVFAAVDLTPLSELISHLDAPRAIEFLMMSRSGAILSCYSAAGGCPADSIQKESLVNAIGKNARGVLELKDSRGVDRFYAYTPLCSSVDTGLFVSIGIPTATLYTTANQVLLFQFAGIWGVTLLALWLVWFGGSVLIIRPVQQMVHTAQHLASGKMDARTGLPRRTGELDSLAEALDHMAETLETRATEVRQYQDRLRNLAAQLTRAEEGERRRIAEGLHDRVGQLLGLAKIKLGMLRQLEAGSASAERAEDVRDLITQAIDETRSLTFQIVPPILYELGLEAALEYLVEHVRTQHGLHVSYLDDARSKPLDEEIRVLLYRAANELLVNVVKHAWARRAVVRTWREEAQVLLSVEDDGVGFDPERDGSEATGRGGFGLFSIRERLRDLGGRLIIERASQAGTRITLIAPLSERIEDTPQHESNCPPDTIR